MNESELYSRLDEYLRQIFVHGSGFGPYWQQEPYKSDLFTIFAQSHEAGCCPHGENITYHLREVWEPYKRLSADDERQLHAMFDAWEEWLYAWGKHGR